MAETTMIEVPFNIDRMEVINSNPLSTWIQREWGMPWLNYLLENNLGIETEKQYDAPRDMYHVTFRFKLDPQKETYYRLKYG
jgi:hypothetical protein